MTKNHFRSFCVVVLFSLLATACGLLPFRNPAEISGKNLETVIAETWEAISSEISPSQTPTLTNTPIPDTLTPQSFSPTLPPTLAYTPSPTNSPFPSITPIAFQTTQAVPSLTFAAPLTPQTTAGQSTPNPTTVPCNKASFVDDITIPDGTELPPNLPFTKIWRIKNNGTCTWTSSYSIIFVSGNSMSGKTTPLPNSVPPGETVDIAVNLVSPKGLGNYKGNWMLSDGISTFGSGSNANQPFWVQIEVVANPEGIVLNFAQSFCSAIWQSASGNLPCPGNADDPDGFVLYLDAPQLENKNEDEATIWTNPQMVNDGWISGAYPALEILPGYRFLADVGCLANFFGCDITFEVYYQTKNNPMQKLGSWHEVYDNSITRIDLDLNTLIGKTVSIILAVRVKSNPQQSAAFWLMPQIRFPVP